MGGLFSKPKVQQAPVITEVKAPVVLQDTVARSAADILRRRKGTGGTVTGASDLGSTVGSVAAKKLLGQ